MCFLCLAVKFNFAGSDGREHAVSLLLASISKGRVIISVKKKTHHMAKPVLCEFKYILKTTKHWVIFPAFKYPWSWYTELSGNLLVVINIFQRKKKSKALRVQALFNGLVLPVHRASSALARKEWGWAG